jgi:para-nitrobenzyl esterase
MKTYGQRGIAWPITDGWIIPDDQYKLYAARRYNDVPVLAGLVSAAGLKLLDEYFAWRRQ